MVGCARAAKLILSDRGHDVRTLSVGTYDELIEAELTGTGKYTGELAYWLADRGHEVRVVTAPPPTSARRSNTCGFQPALAR